MNHTATCGLCQERFGLDEIFAHLREEHDLEFTIEEWPDGEPVIIDRTLEPGDFGVES